MAISDATDQTSLVLDTDVLNDWRYAKSTTQQYIKEYFLRFKQFPALTSLTVFEALLGFENEMARTGKNEDRLQRDRAKTEHLIQRCTVLTFDQYAASIAAYIFPRLSQSDRNKHWRDLFIAATALAHGYGIATRNQKDFNLIARNLPQTHAILRLAVWKP